MLVCRLNKFSLLNQREMGSLSLYFESFKYLYASLILIFIDFNKNFHSIFLLTGYETLLKTISSCFCFNKFCLYVISRCYFLDMFHFFSSIYWLIRSAINHSPYFIPLIEKKKTHHNNICIIARCIRSLGLFCCHRKHSSL